MATVGYDRFRGGNSRLKNCLVDPSWELVDPTPDIHVLFKVFNEAFFWNRLISVEVFWDKNLSTAAGHCGYNEEEGRCWIALSEPLLKFRPRKDLVETLLHEMIHAYLFVTHKRDTSDHGREFHQHMVRINKRTGANISVYHDFLDEVNYYFKHVWVCNGICRSRPPFFGVVQKTEDVPPGPWDGWWEDHRRVCGGSFTKVLPKKAAKPTRSVSYQLCPMCDVYVLDVNKHLPDCVAKMLDSVNFEFEKCPLCGGQIESLAFDDHVQNCLGKLTELFIDEIKCPVCNDKFNPFAFDGHIDKCLTKLFELTQWSQDLNTEFNRCSSGLKKFICPVCIKQFHENSIQGHVDDCLKKHEDIFNDTF